ncbi:hypothetical protein J3A84_13955 [Proteiniclasticum sp. SCR006]|uniref:ABC-2 type transport system permease protein n=1 Tax=Proteiniclasticum aestuarii TaxID=2817862 RepID=A0A939HDS9_9CLOT|nr:hypothetical protein [Proteiniclasticum aestuarii]MBO1266137.1 hypothetical protein [Proteiniclasticum aestuarii]
MMKNSIYVLTRAMFKNDETLSNMVGRSTKKSFFSSKWKIILLVLFLMVTMGLSFGFMISDLYDTLAMMEMESLLLRLLIPAAGIMVFMFGIFYVMNVFYFSKDVDNYLYLPISGGEILTSKFLVSLVYEYFIIIVFFLPILVIFGIKDSAGILYYVYTLVTLILVPVFPLAIASILSMVIMRFSNRFKNRDRFNMIAGVLSLMVALGFNFGIQFLTNRMNQGNELVIGNIAELPIFRVTGLVFPTGFFATEALIGYDTVKGLLYILAMIAASAAALGVFFLIGNAIYFKGVIGVSESKASRKVLSAEDLRKGTARKGILLSYSLKELKLLFRTPIYFLNCVLISLIYPLFILFPIFMGSSGDKDDLMQVLSFIRSVDEGILIVGMAGVGFLLGSVNIISSTAISREGKNFYFLKYIPVPYSTQIYAKILSSFYVEALALVILYGIMVFLFQVDVMFILLSLVIVLLASLVVNQAGILMDTLWPKLNWDTEQKAVKQNFNSVIHMFMGFGLTALSIFLGVKIAPTYFTGFMVVFLLLSILSVVFHFILMKTVEKRFAELS